MKTNWADYPPMSRGTVTCKDRTAQTQNVEIGKPKREGGEGGREGGREGERERECVCERERERLSEY